MSFRNKVIVITGAASGIGLATAEYLAAQGAKLSLCDQNQKLLDDAIARIDSAGGQAIGTAVDVRRRAEVEAWITKSVENYGKLDGAVNAAGVGGKGISVESVHEVSDDDWNFVFDVNVKGVLNALRGEIVNLKDGTSIVNISSMLGVTGSTRMAAYSASKHAVVGLSRVAAKELGPRNIRVNVVCPGLIDTPMLRQTSSTDPSVEAALKAITPLNRIGRPEEVAALIGWLLSDGSSYITGTTQIIDGGTYSQ